MPPKTSAIRAPGGGVPLWGDMAALRVRHLKRFGVAMPDVLCAGTPCQGFSFAGLRGSLADARSNLALTFVRIAHAIDNVREREGQRGLVVLWENVPGVLSTDDNAFGCFLAGLVGADAPLVPPGAVWGPMPHFDARSYDVHRTYGWQSCSWPSEGMAEGPRARAAWRILDAQYFGLAQRRERVFVVVSFRDAIDPAAVLFERLGMRGNSPPRRQAGKATAGTIAARSTGGGGLGTDFDLDGGIVAPEVSLALNVHGGAGRLDAESETLVALPLRAQHNMAHDATKNTLICSDVAGTLTANGNESGGNRFPGMNAEGAASGHLVAHTLPADGFDASEDGTGRSIPLVPVCIHADAIARSGAAVTPSVDADGNVRLRPPGKGYLDDGTAYSLTTGAPHVIAFTSKDHGADAQDDLSPTLRAMGHADSHANAGGQVAVAYNITPSNSNKGYEAREARYAQSVTTRSAQAASARGGDIILQPDATVTPNADDQVAVAIQAGALREDPNSGPDGAGFSEGLSYTLEARAEVQAVATQSKVRRLTPRECERLQGYADDYTLIPTGKRNWARELDDMRDYFLSAYPDASDAELERLAADGPRYKALGNSWPIKPVEWIGRRIDDQLRGAA